MADLFPPRAENSWSHVRSLSRNPLPGGARVADTGRKDQPHQVDPQVNGLFSRVNMKKTRRGCERVRAKSGNFPSRRMTPALAPPRGPSGEFLTRDTRRNPAGGTTNH